MRLDIRNGGWLLMAGMICALVGCGSVSSKADAGSADAAVSDAAACTANSLTCGTDDALYQCDENGASQTKVQDCQYGCSNDHCNECEANTTFCSGDDLVQCDVNGTIVNPQTCGFGCQMNRCNACDPGGKYCDGATAVTCGDDGQPAAMMSCGAPGCLSGVCNTCTPSTTTCQGDTLVACNGQGTVQSATQCALGCSTAPSAHCKALVPSYGVPAPSGSVPNLVVDADATLDIGGCSSLNVLLTKGGQTTAVPNAQIVSLTQSGGPPICVARFGTITVAAGFTLTVTNSASVGHGLSLQSVGDTQINGTIRFTNLATGPAPGSSVSVVGGDVNKAPGPGGGGAAHAGGKGGACLDCSGTTDFSGGSGGAAVTTILTRLTGGSAGGNALANGNAGVGGFGGGALHLVSSTRVIIAATGRIALNGEGGYGGSGTFQICPNRATGGGGSGGTLVVEAPVVSLSAGAVVTANGAGGGGGCTEYQNVGQFKLCFSKSGQPGQLSATRASGGDCTYAGTVGDGGWEANGTTNPSINGYDSDIGAANTAAGGGGGSSGFVILRARTQNDVVFPGTAIVSPQPMLGAVTAN